MNIGEESIVMSYRWHSQRQENSRCYKTFLDYYQNQKEEE